MARSHRTFAKCFAPDVERAVCRRCAADIQPVLSCPLLIAADLPLDEAGGRAASDVKGLIYRIDPADERMRQKRDDHVVASANVSAKTKHVSWKDEGGRHGRHSFSDSLGAERVPAQLLASRSGSLVMRSSSGASKSARKPITLTETIAHEEVHDLALRIRVTTSLGGLGRHERPGRPG